MVKHSQKKMMIEDLKVAIKNHILNSINQNDLYSLCNFFNIPTTDFRELIRKRLIDSILVTNDVDILHRVLFMLNRNGNVIGQSNRLTHSNQIFPLNRNISTNEISPANNLISSNESQNKLYCISNYNLNKCPIDIRNELTSDIDLNNIYIPNFTRYPTGCFQAPSMCPTLTNGRVNAPTVQLPYLSRELVIKTTQFYCCQVILHPVSLLIPRPSPNINQTSRIMSKLQMHFTLSNDTKTLLEAHCSQDKNRKNYKWQVVARFGIYDPLKPFPAKNSSEDHVPFLPECIPPYLTININGSNAQLWDILPSNTTAKEGKRHPRPVNITDQLKFSSYNMDANTTGLGYKQIISVNWWQTPGVYQYYYIGIFLERKVSVNELIDRFVYRTHNVQKPISYTIDFIKDKFSSNQNSKEIDDEDDLVISSVLPISLLCPVGKSRIVCPLRGVNCQHLQCFDAHLYLLMNERRSVWKCPVCDSQATLDDLFVDEYFLKILQEFSDNDKITEVNVNPDCSYTAIAVKESRDRKKHVGNIISNIQCNDHKKIESENEKDNKDVTSNPNNLPIILLESDDEDNEKSSKKISPQSNNSQTIYRSVEISNQNENMLPESSSEKKALTVDLTSDSDNEKEINQITSIINSKITQTCTAPNNIESVMQCHYPHMANHSIQQRKVDTKMMNNFINLLDSSRNDSVHSTNFYQNSTNKASLRMCNPFQPTLKSVQIESSIKLQPFTGYQPQNNFNSSRNYSIPTQLKTIAPLPQADSDSKPVSLSTSSYECQNMRVHSPVISEKNSVLNDLKIDSKNQSNEVSNCKDKLSKDKKSKLSSKFDDLAKLKKVGSRRSSRISNLMKKSYVEENVTDDEPNTKNDGSKGLVGDLKVVFRLKRPNPLDDSNSSTSSQNKSFKKRLVSEASQDEKCDDDDNGKLAQSLYWCVDSITNVKYPVVILNKLDPAILKDYLSEESSYQGFSVTKETNQQFIEHKFDSKGIFNGIKNQF